MTAQGLSLGATVLLILPMIYFTFASLTFFLRGLDDPVVTWMLRGLFSVYFAAVMLACALASAAFALAGRPLVSLALVLLVGLELAARRGFLGGMDRAIGARDADGDGAVRRLRRLHLGGIAWNGAQLVALLAAVPRLFPPPG